MRPIKTEKIYTIEFHLLRWAKICQGFNYYMNGECVTISGDKTERQNPEAYGRWKHFLWVLDGKRYGYNAEKR